MILEKTVDLLIQIHKNYKIIYPKITNIVIGEKYAGVEVASFTHGMFLGLSYMLRSIVETKEYREMQSADHLKNTPIDDLLRWSLEPPGIKKALGLAALNAFSQNVLKINNPYKTLKENLVDYLKIKKTTRIMFIGLIKPMLRRFSHLTNYITIIDDNKSISEPFNKYNCKTHINQLKENELETDILICTGTTLLNDTLEGILRLFKNKTQFFILIGPTASILPDFLFDYGVDIVGGMRIANIAATIQILREGGGTKLFKQYGKKYNLIKE